MRQVSTRRRWLRLSASFVPALLIGLFLVGAVGATSNELATVNVQMGDNFFREASVTVNVGDTVVWTNVGNRPHDVTSIGSGPLNSPRRMMNGATYSYTADTPGTYPYECTIHEGMDGTLIVQAAAQPTTPSAAPRAGMGALAGGPASAWALVLGLGLLLGVGLATSLVARRTT
jgi:plastocyanin